MLMGVTSLWDRPLRAVQTGLLRCAAFSACHAFEGSFSAFVAAACLARLALNDLIVRRTTRHPPLLGGQFQRLFAVQLGLVHQFFDARCQRLRGVPLLAAFGGIRWSDGERQLSSRRPLLQSGGNLREFAAHKFFVELCHFACQACGPVAKNFHRVCDAFLDAVRRFVKNDSALFNAETFEGAPAPAASRGQESHKEKLLRRHAGSGKGSEQRRRTCNRHDGDLVPQAKRYQTVPRIGNQRHACVAYQRDFRALLHGHDQFWRPRHFIVFMVADQRLANVVVREQFLGVPRVFTRDLIRFLERAQRAERNVLEVANGRPHKVQTARGAWVVCRWIPGGHGDQSSMRSVCGGERRAKLDPPRSLLYKNALARRRVCPHFLIFFFCTQGGGGLCPIP